MTVIHPILSGRSRRAQPLSERVLAGPEQVGGGAADDRADRAGGVGVPGEVAAAQKPNAHRLEVVSAREGAAQKRLHRTRTGRFGAFGRETLRFRALVQRKRIDETNGLHARQRRQPVHEGVVELGGRRSVGHAMLSGVGGHLEREDVFGIESRIDAAQFTKTLKE